MSNTGHSLWGLTPLQRSSLCILQPQATGQCIYMSIIYIYIYMNVCVCTHIWMCIYLCIYICMYIYIYIHMKQNNNTNYINIYERCTLYIYVCVCVCVWVRERERERERERDCFLANSNNQYFIWVLNFIIHYFPLLQRQDLLSL